MCDVEDILSNVVGEISEHQADVQKSFCKVDRAIKQLDGEIVNTW